ncbi:MAG: hypothetical protein JNM62_03165 [Flavobacteriales bacterium]|nr:hypothetical protein [Flavobacteriales bacterium]
MDIKGLVADHMGHFSVYDIPNVLFVVVVSACLAFVLARWGARQDASTARRTALWGATTALAAALVRSQLPLAVLMLAVAVLGGRGTTAERDPVLLGAMVIGVGCGSGASVIVLLALIPYLLLTRWGLGEKSV